MLSNLFGIATHFMGSYKYYLLGAFAAFGVLLASYQLGYFNGNKHATQEQIVAIQKDADAKIRAITMQLQSAQADAVAQHNSDYALEQKLTAKVTKLQASTFSLQRLLYAKPDTNPNCYVSNYDVVLLNRSKAASGGDGDQGATDPASVPNDQGQSPSHVSCREVIADDLQTSAQYNELKARQEALIDWVQTNLIDPQAKPDSK